MALPQPIFITPPPSVAKTVNLAKPVQEVAAPVVARPAPIVAGCTDCTRRALWVGGAVLVIAGLMWWLAQGGHGNVR